MNQLICQDTDGQFCAESSFFLLYYYIPVSIVVLAICQLRNYKQLSYIAKIAMIATVIALVAILVDSIIQLMIFMNVEYKAVEMETNLKITVFGHDQTKDINFLLPIFPYFMDCFCKIQISFEGAPFIPKLYTHAKNKHFFVRNLNRGVLFLGITQALMGIICVIAYGSRLQEIVLMNLYYGVFSQFIKFLYAMGMVVNLSLQLIPILEIIETRQPKIYGNEAKEKEQDQTRESHRSDGRAIHAFVYDPNKRSLTQIGMRFANTLGVVSVLLLVTMFLQNFHLLLLIDGAILSNILVLMLPNALYLYQVNYGYLKQHETPRQYLIAYLLFYLSIFNLIYTVFRGIQVAMGELGVKKIV